MQMNSTLYLIKWNSVNSNIDIASLILVWNFIEFSGFLIL